MLLRKRRIRNFFLAIIILMIMFYGYIFVKFKPPNMKIKSPGNGYSIKTSGCSIPSLHPFDPSILQFISKNPQISCGIDLPLVSSDLNTLYVNLPLLQYYNVTNMSNFFCCYQEIVKKLQPPGMYREFSNDSYIISKMCTPFTTKIKLEEEYVRVICKNNGEEIYRDFHSFVPLMKSKVKQKPSVLVIGIDSMSRMNLHRQMPKTVAYIQELTGIEFSGYNKVGDDTFPNLIPALTGKSTDELHNECLTSSKWYKTPTKFDSCEFIWDRYKWAGFLTAFGEDSSAEGLFNSRYKYGFQQDPTDYYWSFFDYVMENEMGYSPENHTTLNSINLCVGSKYIYNILLDYMRKFLATLKDESYFGWFWQYTLFHGDGNLASISDEDYKQLFEELNRTNVLSNTFVLFMSDHGPSSGKLLLTHQGFLEGRLPFLYIFVPPWFDELYPTALKNLRSNSQRLVTTFDIHETLNDLINMDDLTTNILQKRTNELEDSRGISLFLPIPETRTCTSAGIPFHWCSCFQSTPVDISDKIVENIAFYIMNYINLLLDNEENCATLALASIIDARLLISEEFRDSMIILKSKLKLYNYIVTVKTIPGGGIFESTVRCNNCEETGNIQIQGVINRLNKYDKNSNCVIDPNLQMYCNCIK